MTDIDKEAQLLIAKDKVNTLSKDRAVPNYINAVHRTRVIAATATLPILIGGFGLFVFDLTRIPSEYKGSAQGTVMSKTQPVRNSNGKVTSNPRGVVEFQVGEQNYISSTSNKLFGPSVGSKVDVRYNNSDPRQSKVKVQLQQIGALTTLYVLLPCFLVWFAWRFMVNRL